MSPESHRKRRIPLTPEEVAGVIEFKKRRDHIRLIKLKKSWRYKAQNVFNIICFFIFCELVFCYWGPSRATEYEATAVRAAYGADAKGDGTPIVGEIEFETAKGKHYKLLVNDYVQLPEKGTIFQICEDFLLRKDLKGTFEGAERKYRVFAASPVLFLCVFTSFIMLVGICYNLNENEHSLLGLTTVNFMTLLCVLFIS
jgi:hypothetical protein